MVRVCSKNEYPPKLNIYRHHPTSKEVSFYLVHFGVYLITYLLKGEGMFPAPYATSTLYLHHMFKD